MPVQLPRVDPAPVDYIQADAVFKDWLSNLVDVINTALQTIEANIP